MVFLKDKNMKFRLVNLDVRPDFAIWKSWDKRNHLSHNKKAMRKRTHICVDILN